MWRFDHDSHAGDAVVIAPVSSQIPCKQGIFQGNCDFGWLGITTLEPKYAAVQRFPSQFPTPNNREISCTNRVLARWITEFRLSPLSPQQMSQVENPPGE